LILFLPSGKIFSNFYIFREIGNVFNLSAIIASCDSSLGDKKLWVLFQEFSCGIARVFCYMDEITFVGSPKIFKKTMVFSIRDVIHFSQGLDRSWPRKSISLVDRYLYPLIRVLMG